jgi:hypothetical protein
VLRLRFGGAIPLPIHVFMPRTGKIITQKLQHLLKKKNLLLKDVKKIYKIWPKILKGRNDL